MPEQCIRDAQWRQAAVPDGGATAGKQLYLPLQVLYLWVLPTTSHSRIGLYHVTILHLYFLCVAKTFCVKMVPHKDNNFNGCSLAKLSLLIEKKYIYPMGASKVKSFYSFKC